MNWADRDYAIGRGIAAIRHGSGRAYQPFLKALIEYRLPELLAQATGSTFPNVSYGQLALLECYVPSKAEQLAIAHILGTLDEKIELNRQMNKTLEAMAKAIFKSWFVDFEPIPGIEHHKEWEDSPSGKIPKGWRNCTWGDLVTLEYGKGLKGEHAGEGAYPVYGTNGRIGNYQAPLCEYPGIIIGRKGAYRGVHYSSTPFFVIDTAFYVKPRVPLKMRWAFYEILRQDINAMDSGSAIPSTSREDFYRLPVSGTPSRNSAALC